MPTATSPNPKAGVPARDDLDNILDYDQAVDDFLRDIPVDKNNDTTNAQGAVAHADQDPDAEIKVRKQRNPVPKLDEARLLSDEGAPKLRRITKSKLKFKGKGHEFSDISRMLNLYQLWLDDLYPRAKFRDALTMVEKVGHSKRMQITRRAWIDGTRPRQRAESVERVGDVEISGALRATPHHGQVLEGSENRAGDDFFDDILREQQQLQKRPPLVQQENEDMPEDDELDALMAETAQTGPTEVPALAQKHKGPFEDDDANDDEDDLDALLAEDSAKAGLPIIASRKDPWTGHKDEQTGDSFADEEEIMAGMDW